MHDKPLISVIIPAYNCEKYIRDCLSSLNDQTYRNLEIIFINDGSTDRTEKYLEDFQNATDLRTKIITQENRGAACARNRGVALSTGEYVSFVDSDDILLSDYFETMLTTAKANNADVVTSGFRVFNINTGKYGESRVASSWLVTFPNGCTHVFQYSPCAKIISTKLLKDNNIHFVENEVMEDGPFSMAINSIANNAAIPYLGYIYRIHSNSVQTTTEESPDDQLTRNLPFDGYRFAIEKILSVKDEKYLLPLEYIVCKALSGIVFIFCRNADSDYLKFSCNQCANILKTYFPNLSNNPYFKITLFPQLPLTHRCATKIMRFAYLHNCLYQVARILQPIMRILHNKTV